jgi:hypothetical protein
MWASDPNYKLALKHDMPDVAEVIRRNHVSEVAKRKEQENEQEAPVLARIKQARYNMNFDDALKVAEELSKSDYNSSGITDALKDLWQKLFSIEQAIERVCEVVQKLVNSNEMLNDTLEAWLRRQNINFDKNKRAAMEILRDLRQDHKDDEINERKAEVYDEPIQKRAK